MTRKRNAVLMAAAARLGIEEIRRRREPTGEEYRYANEAVQYALDLGATHDELAAEQNRQRGD